MLAASALLLAFATVATAAASTGLPFVASALPLASSPFGQVQEIEGTPRFPAAVALSANGATAAVATVSGEHQGAREVAATVYTRVGKTWVQQGPTLTPAGKTPL